MYYHTQIMLLEILDLYIRITNIDNINIDVLENAFYSSQDLINTKEDLDVNNTFEEELDQLLDLLPDLFTLDNDQIIINDDFDVIWDQLLLEFNENDIELTDLDNYLGDYLENIIIYKALELPIPLNETKDIFNVNKYIVLLHKMLAKYELENKDNRPVILYIKVLRMQLDKFFKEMDSTMVNNLRMCCAHYNELNLIDEDDDFINSNWNIILFSKRQMKALNYAEIEERSFNEEEKEDIYEEDSTDVFELTLENNSFEEIPCFLTYYLIYLNKFIQNNNLDNNVKEELLLDKYLLISLPELKNIEEYYLDNYTINNLEAPPMLSEYLTNTSFELLLPKVMECVLSLDYSDEDINNYTHLYSKIITNCLFIKTFLNLSINQNHKKNLISQITNSKFYKSQEYSITTNLIDEIIFSNNFNLSL